MNWLIWREYRLNRLILMVGLGLLVLPYVIVLSVIWWTEESPPVFEVIGCTAVYSVVFIQLTAALLGGYAIAGERNDRSAQFVAYLPVSRMRRLTAKLSVILTATVVLWGVDLLVFFGLAPELGLSDYSSIQNILGHSAVAGLAFFGVAWLISSLQSSPSFAVAGGLITPLVLIAIRHIGEPPTPSQEQFQRIAYFAICSIVAVVCFSIGTWYYLRRVEP